MEGMWIALRPTGSFHNDTLVTPIVSQLLRQAVTAPRLEESQQFGLFFEAQDIICIFLLP